MISGCGILLKCVFCQNASPRHRRGGRLCPPPLCGSHSRRAGPVCPASPRNVYRHAPVERHPAATTHRRGGAYPKGTGSTNCSFFAGCRWRCSARTHRCPHLRRAGRPQGHGLHRLLILRRVSPALSAPFALSYPGRGGQSRPPLHPKRHPPATNEPVQMIPALKGGTYVSHQPPHRLSPCPG